MYFLYLYDIEFGLISVVTLSARCILANYGFVEGDFLFHFDDLLTAIICQVRCGVIKLDLV